MKNLTAKKHFLEIGIEDLSAVCPRVAELLLSQPNVYLPLLETALTSYAKGTTASSGEGEENKEEEEEEGLAGLTVQLLIHSQGEPLPFRMLDTQYLTRVVKLHGIVVSASRIQARPRHIECECSNRDCKATWKRTFDGTESVALPHNCTQQGCSGYLRLIPSRCVYTDRQRLKLQETPETVPTGELPRHIVLCADRALAGVAVPGARVTVTGVYDAAESGKRNKTEEIALSSVRRPFLRVLGITQDEEGKLVETRGFDPTTVTSLPNLRERLVRSIAPAIYGHTDVKKAMLAQLFGGSTKLLPDGTRRRGDINILLLGDPGTAKSQLLKFSELVAPIGVYTSGKGSSAAGLTASVIRDPVSHEFFLEGGAMVLADGGIVCIDEFDKMHSADRVAIHEAMEQQTISIAKAGITAVLNARTAVLAAANPMFGRYDDSRESQENISFQSTILSRFDMIFLIKDKRNEQRDKVIAEHVIGLHTDAKAATEAAGEIPLHTLKQYIAYCRNNVSPRLSEAAAKKLENYFVTIRAQAREQKERQAGKQVIPITVRQLEAIVRISEANAKMEMQPIVNEAHVDEAIRLFDVSTVDAINNSGLLAATSEFIPPAYVAEVRQAESVVKRIVPIGGSFVEQRLVATLQKQQQLTVFSIRKAIGLMVRRGEFEYRKQRKVLFRRK